MTPADLAKHSRELQRLCAAGHAAQACQLCDRLCSGEPDSEEVSLLASRVYQQLGKFDQMHLAASRAVTIRPDSLSNQLRVVESLIFCGRIDIALELLAGIETRAANDPQVTQSVAEMYLHCQCHADAWRCYRRAADLQPGNPASLFNLAAQSVALGDIDRAHELFNRVIEISPGDFGAYQNRSMLKTWQSDNNHVAELNWLLAGLPLGHASEVPLCYALAKEYEDLGECSRSFAMLERGARSRRSRLAYQVDTDVDAMARICRVFDGSQKAAEAPERMVKPIFVLGLPRSGTTLVDRILSSHSQVDSLGEVNDFAFALVRLASGDGGKMEMIDRSAQIDFGRLGESYAASLASYRRETPWLINKTPQNYLYIGLISLALTDARVVHLRRHPLDSCYAMYKTLFRMGYPFSYDLEDLGHYYLAYHRLMAHWREVVPDAFIDIDYESLVRSQEENSRALIKYCGLAWEPACLEFHKNEAPAATASAAQVRKKVYSTSVNRWRGYEKQLEPLANFLSRNGVNCA